MRIAVCNPDNLGDLLLRQPLFAALHQAGHQLLLVVRDFVAPFARDLAPYAEIAVLPGNPYTRNYTLDSPLGRELVARLRYFAPDLFVVAAYQHTVLEQLLAGELPNVEKVGLSGHLYQPSPNSTLPSTISFATRVTVSIDTPESMKNQLLCGAILGRPVTLPPPVMEPTAEGRLLAAAHRRKLDLHETPYWVVCAGDGPPQGLRNWDLEKWTTLCRRLIDEQGLRLLFIGSESEHESTSSILAGLGPAARAAATITGAPVSISELVGLIDGATGYIGKDTGPMHFAAALGKPVVALFGGGNWPRFVPQARTGTAISVDMPCQGCYWFCRLEQSHCIKSIPVSAVYDASVAAIRGDNAPFAVTLLPRDPQLEARVFREMYESAQNAHRMLDTERANFSQWHEDRVRDISQLRTEIDAVRTQLDRLPTLEQENATLREQLLEAHASREADKALSSQAARESERALALEREVESLLKRLAAEAAEKAALSSAHLEQALLATQLRAEIDSIEARHLGRISDLEKALAQEKRQNEFGLSLVPELRDELIEAHSESSALRGAIHHFAASIGRPDLPYDALFAEVVTRLRSAESALDVLSGRLRAYLGDDAAAAGWLENLERLEQDRQQRLEIIHKLDATLQSVEKDRADRGSQIDALHHHIEHLDRERRSLETKLGFRLLHALRLL